MIAVDPEPEPDRDPHEVLGVIPDAPDPVVKSVFRALAKEAHADQGGNEECDVSELKRARDAFLDAQQSRSFAGR
ncbi:dnaj-like protein [Halorubrum saccharovorum DSM 1137]|uniref:Dnaj-like protein n=1 Tax=Halorubrum saccharovorum DSM 1137 TaxID=1227484 RepID=M0E0Y7_9EURY|nr:hypothetical protein [Halorubrum saccharovorum]ELZ41436.1 dnaj-like protein [Halorubrum saccharovorum DSM 1137]